MGDYSRKARAPAHHQDTTQPPPAVTYQRSLLSDQTYFIRHLLHTILTAPQEARRVGKEEMERGRCPEPSPSHTPWHGTGHRPPCPAAKPRKSHPAEAAGVHALLHHGADAPAGLFCSLSELAFRVCDFHKISLVRERQKHKGTDGVPVAKI